MNARGIQVIALVGALGGTGVCGALLPRLLDETEASSLRYTDVSVDGAPPFVALGTAIGALRGLIVDYLWIKVNIQKEKGLFYEVMADAELITKLQPRFAAVWAFHGHNMAYNISVTQNTQEDRWDWVQSGIRLVRNEGIRANPNDMELHKELAFWFSHKIEGYADDAHLYYKRQFCREWHFLLGEPPMPTDERIAWIKEIADAPSTIEDAERRSPGVKALIQRLKTTLSPLATDRTSFDIDKDFLLHYGMWVAVNQRSMAARVTGIREQLAGNQFFAAFAAIAEDPSVADAFHTLLLHIRKRVLLDEYNMDPERMYEYTRDLGPIDWRNGYAHALYWAKLGTELGDARFNNQEEIYKVLNTDRMVIQAMQGLARYGRMTYDPFSTDYPSRFPEPRWIPAIEKEFLVLYAKHYGTRGGGGDTFVDFMINFMSSAIREAYRSGEIDRAQAMLDLLDEKFGSGAERPNHVYQVPLDVFVRNEIYQQYEVQPHLAPSEAVASLRYGFRVGIGRDDRELYENALAFVKGVTDYFKGNEYNDYVNKFGVGRMQDIIGELETTKQRAFIQLMTDPTLALAERFTIWAKVDEFEPELRLETYDAILPGIRSQFEGHELAQRFTIDQVFPAPPGIEMYRARMAAEEAKRREQMEQQRQRDEAARKTGQ